jgi:MFS family permease
MMSVMNVISVFITPLVGIITDTYGMRAAVILFIPLVIIVAQSLFAFTTGSVMLLLVLLGLASAVYNTAMFSSIPLVVDAKKEGLALGIMSCSWNLGQALFPVIVAAIYKHAGDIYIPNVNIFFISVASVATFVGAYILLYDMSHGSVLNAPSFDR